MSARPLALVVLAAGASRRLGEPKALAALRAGPGGTALELLLAAGAGLGDGQPLVVTGAEHERIAARPPAGVELVWNRGWSAGRTGSLGCAAACRPGRDLCVAPVDVPLVPRAVFVALAGEWVRLGRPARGWLAPSIEDGSGSTAQQRFGHPVVLGRELAARLKEFPPDRPLSDLRALAEPLCSLPVASEAILDDLDSTADLARLRARLREPEG